MFMGLVIISLKKLLYNKQNWSNIGGFWPQENFFLVGAQNEQISTPLTP